MINTLLRDIKIHLVKICGTSDITWEFSQVQVALFPNLYIDVAPF